MSKSILVMNTPKECLECRLYATTMDEYAPYCSGTADDINVFIENGGKPDWCPLKDAPEKKQEKQYLTRKDERGNTETYGETKDAVAIGWNMCIDEILKGANGNE